MCGKFTAMASWTEATSIAEALADGSEAGNDGAVTYRVMNNLPVILWDAEAGRRRVAMMRWGFPHRDDPRHPDPIHARAETIDQKPTFRDAFLGGRRGIVLVKTFNEAPYSGIQHVVAPDAAISGIAFLWRRFGDLLACVMVTVPANRLISTLPTDRMPAILATDDWVIWLGEVPAPPERVKPCLKSVEDVRWTMTPEQRAGRPRRKPTMSDPGGLF